MIFYIHKRITFDLQKQKLEMEFAWHKIIDSLFLVGAIQGLVLTIFLFSIKSNKIANRLLGLLTFFWSIILSIFAIQSQGLFVQFPHLLKTFAHVEFTFFPLLYLHVKYLLSKHNKFNVKDLVHFIPLIINILLYSGFYFQSAEDKLIMARAGEGYYYIATIISDEILTIQGIVYPILILVMMRNYNSKVVNYQSFTDRKDLKLLRLGIILSLISWIFGITAFNLSLFNIEIGFDLFILCYLFIVIIIYIISYIAIWSPEVFKLSEDHVVLFSAKDNYSTDQKDYDGLDKLNEKLVAFMNGEKPFLNSELSLQELADELEISRHQLSALINQKQKMNFYEFVNNYRVNELKSLLGDSEKKHIKMIELAYEAGFNSKASYNRIFKQLAAQTPSEYKESLRMA